MNEPTETEIKRFWEHWGFQRKFGGEWRYAEFKTTNGWWEAPNGRKYKDLPPIDLKNLFKYAVPHLPHLEIETWLGSVPFSTRARVDMGKGYRPWESSTDPVLAIFWAIYKVIERES